MSKFQQTFAGCDGDDSTHIVNIRQVHDDARVVGRLVGFALVMRDYLRAVPKAHELEENYLTID